VTNEDIGFRSNRGFQRGGGSNFKNTNFTEDWDVDGSSESSGEKGDTSGFTFTHTEEKEEFESFSDDGDDPFGEFEFGGPPTGKNTLVTGTPQGNQQQIFFQGNSNPPQGNQQNQQSIFGNPTPTPTPTPQGNPNIFGNPTSQGNQQNQQHSIFGNPNPTPQGNQQNQQSIFGNPNQSTQNQNQQSIFGNPNQSSQNQNQQSIFGNPNQSSQNQNQQSIFGNPNPQQNQQNIFGNPQQQNQSSFLGNPSGTQSGGYTSSTSTGSTNPKDPWANFKFDLEGISNPNKQMGVPLGQTFQSNPNSNLNTNTNNFGFL